MNPTTFLVVGGEPDIVRVFGRVARLDGQVQRMRKGRDQGDAQGTSASYSRPQEVFHARRPLPVADRQNSRSGTVIRSPGLTA